MKVCPDQSVALLGCLIKLILKYCFWNWAFSNGFTIPNLPDTA